jgi:hypothetical protein
MTLLLPSSISGSPVLSALSLVHIPECELECRIQTICRGPIWLHPNEAYAYQAAQRSCTISICQD